jgi:hypothetical protein
MNKLFKIVALTFLVFQTVSVYAQQPVTGQDAYLNAFNLGGNSAVARTWDNRYEGVRGTPYWKNTWEYVKITSVDGKVYSNVPLKYDVYSNMANVKNSKGDSISTELTNIKEIQFLSTGQIFVKEPLLDKTDDVKNYGRLYEQLYKGSKVTFYQDHRKEFIKADYQGGYNANRRYDELVDEKVMYLKNGNRIEKIKINEKSVLRVLSDKEKELKEFIKKEKISIRTDKDVIRVIKYYETL